MGKGLGTYMFICVAKIFFEYCRQVAAWIEACFRYWCEDGHYTMDTTTFTPGCSAEQTIQMLSTPFIPITCSGWVVRRLRRSTCGWSVTRLHLVALALYPWDSWLGAIYWSQSCKFQLFQHPQVFEPELSTTLCWQKQTLFLYSHGLFSRL